MTHPPRGQRHTQTGSIRLNAPAETVWDFITAVDSVCLWYDTWDTVDNDTTDPRLRVGSSFHLTRRSDGGPETARCEVTDLAAPTRLCWEQSSPDAPTMTVSFVLKPGTDSGTIELEHTRTWTAP